MDENQLHELLYQSLETERGGVAVYTTALRCAVNDDLKEEWQKYLDQTSKHQQVVTELIASLGLDPDTDTPGRRIVAHIGESLVGAMEMAMSFGPPEAAELVAGECVVHAETKDHLNWELLQVASEHTDSATAAMLRKALDDVEEEEDEHLYHSTGWTRELWLQSLGLDAVLPPPEERKHVTTAIGAARAKNARDTMTSD